MSTRCRRRTSCFFSQLFIVWYFFFGLVLFERNAVLHNAFLCFYLFTELKLKSNWISWFVEQPYNIEKLKSQCELPLWFRSFNKIPYARVCLIFHVLSLSFSFLCFFFHSILLLFLLCSFFFIVCVFRFFYWVV